MNKHYNYLLGLYVLKRLDLVIMPTLVALILMLQVICAITIIT
jgi:hypothetical protein